MEEKYYNALAIIFKDHFSQLTKLKNKYNSYENIWKNIDSIIANNFIKVKGGIDVDQEFENLQKQDIKILLLENENYPHQLKEISNPPLGLYVKGSWDILENSQNNILLAIVGSRCATNYGKLVIDKIIKELAPYNFTIVSGLALGIDTFSHQFAIKYHLKTVAVLGSGLDIIYPASNQNLYKSIIEKGGCIVSEYPLHIKPQEFRFPQRNRIISGLSSGILVVEARDKSGSLITARLGLEQNREIFAIPNSIFAKNSEGANKLIQQGAKLVLKGADILEEFNIQTNEILPNISWDLSREEESIFNVIQENEEIDADFIRECLPDLSISQILANLTSLEMKGLVQKVKNNKYISSA